MPPVCLPAYLLSCLHPYPNTTLDTSSSVCLPADLHTCQVFLFQTYVFTNRLKGLHSSSGSEFERLLEVSRRFMEVSFLRRKASHKEAIKTPEGVILAPCESLTPTGLTSPLHRHRFEC